jgi:uncharacterized membrane protein YhhN
LPFLCSGLFWFVALVNIWALYTQNTLIDLITKPLLIPLLILYYISHKKRDSTYFLIQFISWVGSLFFIGETPLTTITGIICFWAAILLYTYVIIQHLDVPVYNNLRKPKRIIPLIIYLIYFILVITLLGPNLKGLFGVITAYALTITFLCFTATIYYLEDPKNQFRFYLLIGILLLFLDASIICYQLFNHGNTIISLSVRIIFILAHYLICLYFVLGHQTRKNP